MTRDTTDRRLLDAWRNEVYQAFDEAIGTARRVAFLQYPYNGNVGNHMMWLALVEYLRARNIRIVYAAHHANFRVEELRAVIGSDPILFSGGVTLSQLWPWHPEMKKVVAEEFPDNRIVSLTSTMIFVDEADERGAAAVFGPHRDVVVMARDPQSAANASALLPRQVRVVTAPDSAFGLPLSESRRVRQRTDIIWQARDDHESTGAASPPDVQTFDWPHDLWRESRLGYVVLRASGVLSRTRSTSVARRFAPFLDPVLNSAIVWCYVTASRRILSSGHKSLDAGRVLVTDRMHPHVLAALRGQQVVLLPDRFGKNRAVFDFMTSKLSCVHWAATPLDALATARLLASGRG